MVDITDGFEIIEVIPEEELPEELRYWDHEGNLTLDERQVIQGEIWLALAELGLSKNRRSPPMSFPEYVAAGIDALAKSMLGSKRDKGFLLGDLAIQLYDAGLDPRQANKFAAYILSEHSFRLQNPYAGHSLDFLVAGVIPVGNAGYTQLTVSRVD